jgi:DNA-binding MurR/RpiR family transcriptional regulator
MISPQLQLTERIHRAYSRLTPGDRKIADHLLRTYPGGLLESASAIAQSLGLHVSTVTRFFPKIGYPSIRSAHRDVRAALDFLVAAPPARVRRGAGPATGDTALFQEVLRLDLRNLQETFKAVAMADVRRCMRLLLDRNRGVYVFGPRKHYSLSYYAFLQLHGVRENVFLAATENFLVADLLARLTAGDVLWLFDFRRYPRLSAKVAAYGKEAGAKLVLFTDSALAPLAGLADVRFTVATRGAAWFDSYTAGTALVNALLAEYVRQAGGAARERYAVRERLFRHFEIFTQHEGLPAVTAGRRPAASGNRANA